MLKSRSSVLKAGLLGASMLGTLSLTGCATAAYSVLEAVGVEKRDVLVDRVIDAAKTQADAKEQFADTLEAFRAVVSVDGGELEKTYDKLNAEYKRSEKEAEYVRYRINDVKKVSRDLFREWEKELNEYTDPGLRRASEEQLQETRVRYDQLVAKMDKAAASMDPVLGVFKDRVLYLKHNLNARAIVALGDTTAELEADVEALIADMERSIAEADAFIADMQTGA